jgi:hypothetical protein
MRVYYQGSKQQCVKIIKGVDNVENEINAEIEKKNKEGWALKSVSNHFGKVSIWCLLFER